MYICLSGEESCIVSAAYAAKHTKATMKNKANLLIQHFNDGENTNYRDLCTLCR